MSEKAAPVEIVPPSDRLARKAGSFAIDAERIAKVDRVLETLSEQYPQLARGDIEALTVSARRLAEAPADPGARKELYRLSHGLKGNAATLGYPLVTAVAASLCKLIEQEETPSPLALRAIAMHADALRSIVAERLSGDGGAIGRQLLSDLARLVETLAKGQAA